MRPDYGEVVNLNLGVSGTRITNQHRTLEAATPSERYRERAVRDRVHVL